MADIKERIEAEYEAIEKSLSFLPSSKLLEDISNLELAGLLNNAKTENIISTSIFDSLKRYLAFRHFFIHAYAIDLHSERLKPLVADALSLFQNLKTGINSLDIF